MTQFKPTESPWRKAAGLCESYQAQPAKAETLITDINFHSSAERRRCQFLFYGVLRHRRRIDELLARLISRPPKPRLAAMLQVAVFELMAAEPARQPKVVDYAVGQIRRIMSRSEAGLANAVLRKIPAEAAKLDQEAPAAVRLSHPDWLARRWQEHYGPESAETFMAWNLEPPPVLFRARGELPAGLPLEPAAWPGFYKLAGEWARVEPLLNAGRLYAQDPSTRLAPEALAVRPGEKVLDLCAAPGGKALMLIDALESDRDGLMLAVDLPGPRLEPLNENLQKLGRRSGPAVSLLGIDVRRLSPELLRREGFPETFDAVLLDAPCSNTGVLRRRPDAKWRLEPGDIAASAELQGELLAVAAERVKPGGRLVYSTCSVEPEENQAVIKAFLGSVAGKDFSCRSQTVSLPWETGHDGAGVALLVRR
ncbi:RsmB/NOP family class I SAM-dependent RNA methyltransferase [Ruficoccus amylovorans]|uniref:RsmB/NOP family class I SAM-dependent RNA methyltransferase n=1 Tax=Ruficoccus amylovorans TaxID=1804625 RepID=A0A842HL49_9BACT|nr:RsmB/NOP family class I SAM-dependent RNA methyltransferase [Ruficoccus amylovorans]MBC2596414.1 RsmB/NOP family class I SAM-dependent RNA methyltransferase [Ruficoccus amylovorans]